MSDIIIYHNPSCGTSRNVLEMIRAAGHEPTIIEYLKTPLSRAQLADLLKRLKIAARELLRAKGDLYDTLKPAANFESTALDATPPPSLPLYAAKSKWLRNPHRFQIVGS